MQGITPFSLPAHRVASLIHRTAALVHRCDIFGETRLHENPTRTRPSHNMPKRKTTVTSTFGSPGREGHDSSAFYNTRLYADRAHTPSGTYVENQIPELDVIYQSSCEEMKELLTRAEDYRCLGFNFRGGHHLLRSIAPACSLYEVAKGSGRTRQRR